MLNDPRSYAELALRYDELFAPIRGPVDSARERILARILPNVRSACDLGCGTGVTTLALAHRGFQMFAVDLSPGMCRITREKARHAQLKVRVIRADMRDFRLPYPVDLITCEGDALNHIPSKADLASVAQAVARALHPGGHFFFDINNRAGFKRYWTGTMFTERPGLMVYMRNGNDHQNDRAWTDIDLFVRNGNSWKLYRERVEEVCWSPAEIRTAFQNAGFDRIRSWDATPFFEGNPIMRPGCRSFYLARKAA
jgi:SAM-dependent methyltransferase